MKREFYSIKKLKKIELGRQYERGITTVIFTDVEGTLEDVNDIVRLSYSHKDVKNSPLYIPLIKTEAGYELPVDELFTELAGNYVCTVYGYTLNADGSTFKRALSDQFIMHTTPAQNVKKAEKAEHIPEVLKDIYEAFAGLIKEVKEKLANGEFKGADGRDGKNGLVIPTHGMFSLFINDEGHLIVVYNGSDSPPSLYIDESGHLIFGEREGDQQ